MCFTPSSSRLGTTAQLTVPARPLQIAMFAVAAILPSLAVNNPTATLSTSMGDIKIELFLDRVPRTASNFIDLAQSGASPAAIAT